MSKSQAPARASRRGFMLGAAATAGAATAAVVLAPKLPADAAVTPEAPRPKPERGGGYHLSEHVKQYYKTTLV